MRVANNNGNMMTQTRTPASPMVVPQPAMKLQTRIVGEDAVPVFIRMFINDDEGARSAAFGAMTFDTPIGKMVLENLKVLRNQSTGSCTAMTPFRIVPDKQNGGAWTKCKSCNETIADKSKATRYENSFGGEAAESVKAIFLAAFNECNGCQFRQIPATKKAELAQVQARLNELEAIQDEEKDTETALEYGSLLSKLSNVYKRCVSTPAFMWDGTECSCKSKASVETVETTVEEAEDLDTSELDEAIAAL